MTLEKMYAFVTSESWQESLITRWPDAPLHDRYRLLVFTNEELPKLEVEYSNANFKYFSIDETIEAMENNDQPPFILNLDDAREVCAYFAPTEEII